MHIVNEYFFNLQNLIYLKPVIYAKGIYFGFI